MAMTKKEQAELQRLRDDLDLARAMRWPDYAQPAPMTEAEIKANLVEGGLKYGSRQMVARGWFCAASTGRVTYGCSSGLFHSREGDTTNTQNMGVMYATKADALRAMRIEMTQAFARNLAEVDKQIMAEEREG